MRSEFKASFLKSVKKIDEYQLKAEISSVIQHVETAETIKQIKNLKKLKGYKQYYRIRIGDYRIGLKIEANTVIFVDIDHRRNIYRIFP